VIKVIFTGPYLKKADKFLKKHPDLSGQYHKTLKLLEINPYHPSLRLHKLTGKRPDIYSVSINISYRVAMEFYIKEDTIIPVSVGTHEEGY